MKTPILARVDPKFKRELEDIRIERIRKGEKMVSIRRLTKAIRRLPDWDIIKTRLINAEIKEDYGEID